MAIRLGTRGSALALAQTQLVAEAIGGDVEVVTLTTRGDRDRALIDKSKWVAELERALLDGEIDVAVHSAKDVPAALADGTVLAGALPRADPADGLVGASSLAALEPGARVGTSALRRAAQIRAVRDDLEIVEIRGNVDTRLRKLADGDVDAVVLARAGLARLGRPEPIAPLDTVPAAGQGVVLLQTLDGFDAGSARLPRDASAWAALRAERACVAALGADCYSAVGAHATPGGDALTLRAWAGRVDGSEWASDVLTGAADDPEALGAQVAARMLAAGAAELIAGALT